MFHHKTHRVSGHLFISVLAYHLVHTIRFQLKASGIHLSWSGIRRELMGQNRVTLQLKRADGKTLHVRKTTRAEPRQHAGDDDAPLAFATCLRGFDELRRFLCERVANIILKN